MALPDWSRLFQLPRRERPRAALTFDDRGASCRWPDGTVQSVSWEDVDSIEIRTTDAGPFVEDVFLVILAGEGNCVIPQEADGFGPLLDFLREWPGFDPEAVVAAMTCTDNATFPCWSRDVEGDARFTIPS